MVRPMPPEGRPRTVSDGEASYVKEGNRYGD